MGRRSNSNYFCLLAFIIISTFAQAQENARAGEKDYKDKNQFKKFSKRRLAIGAWQINQLKHGALVVRLKTNVLLINRLLKNGDTTLALEKQFENAGINLNTIRAYIHNYSFSKVYFIYSHYTDSLLNGQRKNIFLDSNLVINPSIEMTEKFYLLAERDYSYNSSIGFIPEDSAKFVKEQGYQVKEMAVVLKNKYGHQLKKPFPYCLPDRPDFKIASVYVTTIKINGVPIPFNVGGLGRLKEIRGGDSEAEDKRFVSFMNGGKRLLAFMPRHLTFERISVSIGNLDEELKRYYRQNSIIGNDKTDPNLKPFLY